MNNSTVSKIKVSSMQSPSTGRPVANQFEIYTYEGTYFQSYNSIIAVKRNIQHGFEVIPDENYWDYSRTTGKYRNIFLNEGIADTRKKIKDGVYKLADLN